MPHRATARAQGSASRDDRAIETNAYVVLLEVTPGRRTVTYRQPVDLLITTTGHVPGHMATCCGVNGLSPFPISASSIGFDAKSVEHCRQRNMTISESKMLGRAAHRGVRGKHIGTRIHE